MDRSFFMRVIANKILLLIESRGVKLNHDRETYIYGLSQWLYTIFSTSLLLLWGIIWGYSFESVILILVFYANQSYGGGFHADSHIKCLCTMIVGQCVYFLLLNLKINIYNSLILSLISLGILYGFPLVLHKNKLYLEKIKDKLIRKSHYLVIGEGIAYLASLLVPFPPLSNIISLALLLSAVSRLGSIYINKSRVLH